MTAELTPFIPFVSGLDGAKLTAQTFSDCYLCRVSLQGLENYHKQLANFELWIDVGLDGVDADRNPTFEKYLARHNASSLFDEPKKLKRLKDADVAPIVNSMLSEAAAFKPLRLSVPQLPLANDGSRNGVNRMLAAAARAWALKHGYADKLILPVIVRRPSQIRGKTQRTPKVTLLKKCLVASGATTVWVVESEFNEQRGAESYAGHIKSIIDFHQEIRNAIGEGVPIIGGPYWGLQFVLWARGLTSAAAFSVGTAPQYFLTGGKGSPPVARLAVPPLLRTITATLPSREWLRAAARTKSGDPRSRDIANLVEKWDLLVVDKGKKQIAEFVHDWMTRLAKIPEKGRALGLYQELSQAYVFGSGLTPLPAEKGKAKEPARVAQQLMLVTLA